MPARSYRYKNSHLFKNSQFQGIRHRKIIPAKGVIEYTVKDDDRLDLLSLYFYNDSRLWWKILDANPSIIFGMDVMLDEYVGKTIVVPQAID